MYIYILYFFWLGLFLIQSQNGGKPQCHISVLENEMEGRRRRAFLHLSGPPGDSLEVSLGEVSVPSPSVVAALGLPQVNGGSEMSRKHLLPPGNLASRSVAILEEFWPKATAGPGREAGGP